MSALQTCTLEGVELFHGLPPQELTRLSAQMYCRTYPSNSNLIMADQPGEVVYIILSGTVKIHNEQTDGKDVVLAILGPGDIVGEMSLLDSSGRSASVVTLEESTLLWMGRSEFQDCLDRYPLVSRNLVRILTQRVRLANELIQALATLDVHGRLARQLLAFAEKYGQATSSGEVSIPIRLTQGELADLVGASRKRVNQAMVVFKNLGYIRVDPNGRVTVLQRDALLKYCR